MADEGVRQRSFRRHVEPTLWELANFKPKRKGVAANFASLSRWHYFVAWLNTFLCALYMVGTVDGILHPHIEGLKLSREAWAAVRNTGTLSVPKYVGLGVGFAAVSAAWGIYAAYGNPWTRMAFTFYVGIKALVTRQQRVCLLLG